LVYKGENYFGELLTSALYITPCVVVVSVCPAVTIRHCDKTAKAIVRILNRLIFSL